MNVRNIIHSMVVASLLAGGAGQAQAAEQSPTGAAEVEITQSALSVNVNTANAEELADLLNGVGMARAQAIIDYREKHGPFRQASDLVLVKGIGQATVDRNLQVIRLK